MDVHAVPFITVCKVKAGQMNGEAILELMSTFVTSLRVKIRVSYRFSVAVSSTTNIKVSKYSRWYALLAVLWRGKELLKADESYLAQILY